MFPFTYTVYIDMGNDDTGDVSLHFTIDTSSNSGGTLTTRQWEIKAFQINCNADGRQRPNIDNLAIYGITDGSFALSLSDRPRAASSTSPASRAASRPSTLTATRDTFPVRDTQSA